MEKTENELIAEFMPDMEFVVPVNVSYKPYWKNKKTLQQFPPGKLKYDKSWDWLMPACEKFSYIFLESEALKDRTTDEYAYYLHLCERLDRAVTKYQKGAIIKQLIHNIKWFNAQNKQ